MDLGLEKKVALITGASRGVGLEIARAFAKEGARVTICSRSRADIEAAAEEVRSLGGECVAIVADLFAPEECIRVVDETVDQLGQLDVLINNASTDVSTQPSRLEDVSDTNLLERVMGKAMGAVRCSRAALKHLRNSTSGRIICIGGDAARTTSGFFNDGRPGSALAAGLGNALLVNFAKRLSNETAPYGITVNVLHPGQAVSGERWDRRVARIAEQQGITVHDAYKQLAHRIPIGRPVNPADIAPLVVFLASAHASAITGQSIAVDGGTNPQVIY